MPTEVAPMVGTIAGVTSSTADMKLLVARYLEAHFSPRQLDRMCATPAGRDLAAMAVFPDHRAPMTDDQRALAKSMKQNFGLAASCRRSLVREVLTDRQASRSVRGVRA